MMAAFEGSKIRLGILGGGQLGRMLVQKAIDFNLQTLVLDPDPDAPCRDLCTRFEEGNFRDYKTVLKFGASADVITVEIEHVNVDALDELERMGKHVFPQPSVLRIVQDKGLQKEFYRINTIPTAEFRLVSGKDEIMTHVGMFPVMQKLRRSGYDGKGVKPLRSKEDIDGAFTDASVLERMVDFEREISVIVSRNVSGQVAHFPVVDMDFNPEANLVEFLYSPSSLNEKLSDEAIRIARNLIEKLNHVGLLAVEMFVTREEEILVNEIAPRPHNSGHHTIEGNVTSQYEQHLRAILNLPPGDTSLKRPSVMINLLGEKGNNGEAVYEGFDKVMAIPGAHVHLYGKRFTKPFRKMGHITITADTIEEARKKAKEVSGMVKVVSN
jgi:5-(carboxyamino)imidazole ribonucleotide synthase